ncbi:hypothetical protein [Ancylobacter sp. SL191]|uniref:hypothetical protein n=1 Tax=Ancylobacter sp. SL191 TaxID=2995166 RepID=UPI00227022EC|nr:hypothetical protein [Ancylobacter sp. SL191]WAC26784.1 hypothetical protein OU996_17500 [Ancylobacter sp. SL191]
MKTFIIATAAVASLGFAGAASANQQSYSNTTWQETTTGTYQSAPRTNYVAPGYDARTGMIEGRNSAVVDPSRATAGSYVDSHYGDGLTTYQSNPGVEPYIAKQIEMDQRGSGN